MDAATYSTARKILRSEAIELNRLAVQVNLGKKKKGRTPQIADVKLIIKDEKKK